nr:HNH endonuclease family protein [Nitrosomonas nitrosa]
MATSTASLPKARMALMLRLEALVSDGSKKQVFDHLSLEHVLLQTPPAASDWIKWFPDEDERGSWTHRLANLVPLHVRKNPAASNYDLPPRRTCTSRARAPRHPSCLPKRSDQKSIRRPRFCPSARNVLWASSKYIGVSRSPTVLPPAR